MQTTALVAGLLVGGVAALLVGTVIAAEAQHEHPQDPWWDCCWWDWHWGAWGWDCVWGGGAPVFGHAHLSDERVTTSYDAFGLRESASTHVLVTGARLQDLHVYLVASTCAVQSDSGDHPSYALAEASTTFPEDDSGNESSHAFDATLTARLAPGEPYSVVWVAHAHSIFPARACRDLLAGPVADGAAGGEIASVVARGVGP